MSRLLSRNHSLPPNTNNQFPVQVPTISGILNCSSMHVPKPSPLVLILEAIRDFSVGEKKVFGPWLTIQR